MSHSFGRLVPPRPGPHPLNVATDVGGLRELATAVVPRNVDAAGLARAVDELLKPLGTVGALALIDGLDEPFLVVNGDVLTDLDYKAMLDHHVASGTPVTVAATLRHVNNSLV